MLIKIHNSYRTVAAVCDSDLIGKHLEEDEKQLSITENFYKGEEKTEDELLALLQDLAKEDATFNIVGNDSVSCALRAGIISEQGVMEVQGVKYALVLL